MSNMQLYLAIGLPTVLVMITILASILSNRQAFKNMDQRFDAVDQRFDGIDRRLDRIETRLDRVETRLDRIDDEVRKDHEHRLTRLESKVFAA